MAHVDETALFPDEAVPDDHVLPGRPALVAVAVPPRAGAPGPRLRPYRAEDRPVDDVRVVGPAGLRRPDGVLDPPTQGPDGRPQPAFFRPVGDATGLAPGVALAVVLTLLVGLLAPEVTGPRPVLLTRRPPPEMAVEGATGGPAPLHVDHLDGEGAGPFLAPDRVTNKVAKFGVAAVPLATALGVAPQAKAGDGPPRPVAGHSAMLVPEYYSSFDLRVLNRLPQKTELPRPVT